MNYWIVFRYNHHKPLTGWILIRLAKVYASPQTPRRASAVGVCPETWCAPKYMAMFTVHCFLVFSTVGFLFSSKISGKKNTLYFTVLNVLRCFEGFTMLYTSLLDLYLFRGWMSNGSETSPQSSCLKRGHLQGTHSHPMLDVRESYSLRVMRCQRSDRGNQNRRFGRNRM